MSQETSIFNPDTFLDTSTDQPLSTKPVLHPIGQYISLITGVKAREITGGPNGKMRFLDVQHEVDGNQPLPDGSGRLIKDVTNRDKMTVTDSVILDLTPDGRMDLREGMNFRVGRYLAALNQNTPGQVWSPRNLVGQALKVTIGHRADPKDPETVYTQVNGIEKAA